MCSAKRISTFLNNIICYLILIFFFEGIACSQNKLSGDSVKIQPVSTPKTFQNNIRDGKASPDFYHTDSIFSLRSRNGYIPSLIHNIGVQAVSPFHFKAKQWIYTGVAAGITAALIFADEDIDAWARNQKQKHAWVKKSSPVISEFGSNYGVYSVVAAGLISAIANNKKGVQTSLLATQAMITSGIWTQLIKQLTGRERPKASYIFSHLEGGQWHGVFSKYLDVSPDDRSRFSYDAFPSGHTATAFSIATVFATQYNDNKAIPVFCYSAATLVGISRMTEHEHWASDVFVGALLGYVSGKQVIHNYNRTHPKSITPFRTGQNTDREITFIQRGNQIGFSIVW